MGRPRQEECSPQDNALGLMHLRRLFSELCHPPRHMTQKEQEEKLYMMLPVFNRVSQIYRADGDLELEVNLSGTNSDHELICLWGTQTKRDQAYLWGGWNRPSSYVENFTL